MSAAAFRACFPLVDGFQANLISTDAPSSTDGTEYNQFEAKHAGTAVFTIRGDGQVRWISTLGWYSAEAPSLPRTGRA